MELHLTQRSLQISFSWLSFNSSVAPEHKSPIIQGPFQTMACQAMTHLFNCENLHSGTKEEIGPYYLSFIFSSLKVYV